MVTTLLMFAAGAGAIFGLTKMKQGREWGKGVLIACAILAILLAVPKILNPRGQGISERELARRQKKSARYLETSGEMLGRYLAGKFPGARAVVMRPLFYSDVDPEAPAELFETVTAERLSGLKAGLGDAIELVDVIHPTAPASRLINIEEMKRIYHEEHGEGEVPAEYYKVNMQYDQGLNDLTTVQQFNDFAKKIPAEANLVILLMNFPDEVDRWSVWKKDIPVAGIVSTVTPKLGSAVEAGYISALVVGKPGADYAPGGVPGDFNERFNRYFILVTPDNVKEVVETFATYSPPVE